MAVQFDYQGRFDQAKNQIQGGFRDNLMMATMEWHSGVVNDMLSGTRTGRTYRIPGSNVEYQASAPGEPPATQTGRLRQSYQFRVNENGGQLVGEVGSPLDYALYLEKGTSNMAPRPHLYTAYEHRKSSITQFITRVVLS